MYLRVAGKGGFVKSTRQVVRSSSIISDGAILEGVLSVAPVWFVKLEFSGILVDDIILPLFFIILYLCQCVLSLFLSVSHLYIQYFRMSPTYGTHNHKPVTCNPSKTVLYHH